MPLTPLHEAQGDKKDDIAKDLDVAAKDLEVLRVTYEQYFLGLERLEPIKLRDKVSKLIKKHAGASVQGARLKFRLQQITARYNTFANHWDHILKQIEEGKYERDNFKWKVRHQNKEPEKVPAPKDSTSKAAPTPKATDPMEALFNHYVDMRKKCNESVQGLSLDGFRKQMQTQVATIQQKTGAKGVKFSIVAEGGKAKIKAIPQQKK